MDNFLLKGENREEWREMKVKVCLLLLLKQSDRENIGCCLELPSVQIGLRSPPETISADLTEGVPLKPKQNLLTGNLLLSFIIHLIFSISLVVPQIEPRNRTEVPHNR